MHVELGCVTSHRLFAPLWICGLKEPSRLFEAQRDNNLLITASLQDERPKAATTLTGRWCLTRILETLAMKKKVVSAGNVSPKTNIICISLLLAVVQL
jgi:hypothetical protein